MRGALFAALVVAAAGCQCGREGSGLELEPPALDFGVVPVGVTRQAQADLVNRGGARIQVASLAVDPGFGAPAPYAVAPGGPTALAPGARLALTLSYSPTAAGEHSARVAVVTAEGELTLLLTGRAEGGPPADGGLDGGEPADGGEALDGGSCEGVVCDLPPGPCYAAPGTCSAGHCRYPSRPAGQGCDDGDPCTVGDSCGDGAQCLPGAPRTCATPPAAHCLDAQTRRTYSSTGSCLSDGGCGYAAQDTPCASGCDAASGACLTCTPKTCVQLGKNCGDVDDGCGAQVSCGHCPSGQTCGGGGPNVCGVPCGASCTSWTGCSSPGEGCDTHRGCCVPCGAAGAPCCVDWSQGRFYCGDGGTSLVCGRSSGSGGTVGYYCCANQGDGCCQQGRCSSTGTCCKCPANGLNFCVQPSFGCGGCSP